MCLFKKVTIRNHGDAFDQEEFLLELMETAVPVRDAAVEVRTALAVHAPVARLSLKQALQPLPAMHQAAERMGALLQRLPAQSEIDPFSSVCPMRWTCCTSKSRSARVVR